MKAYFSNDTLVLETEDVSEGFKLNSLVRNDLKVEFSFKHREDDNKTEDMKLEIS